EPPHVGVATITTPETTAQHVFTRASPAFALELAPSSLASELGDALMRGAKAAATIGLALFLLVLVFPIGLKDTALLFAVFLAGDLVALCAGGKIAHALIAVLPFAAAGAVAWAA